MSGWGERLRRLFGGRGDRLNLRVEAAYAIKASRDNPYFQALEQRAREEGFLGEFVVDEEGWLRPGRREGLETVEATLALDVYPNPAAVERRTIADYEDTGQRRRPPRATLVLADGSEIFLRRDGDRLQASGPALDGPRTASPPSAK